MNNELLASSRSGLLPPLQRLRRFLLRLQLATRCQGILNFGILEPMGPGR